MTIALEIHLGFAFFVFLVALFVGWVQMGRRVMVTLLGIQALIGLIVAGIARATHMPLPGTIWIHIAGGLLAMAAYFAGRRAFDLSPKNLPAALLCSGLGFVLVIFAIWYGSTVTLAHRL